MRVRFCTIPALLVAIAGVGSFACGSTLARSLDQEERFRVNKIAFDPWRLAERTDDSEEFVAKFPSAYSSGVVVNDTVTLRVVLPRAVPRPVPIVLILHYWGAKDLLVERSLAAQLVAKGVGAAILTLPYHLERTPAGLSSGELAIQPEPAKLIATSEQSVMDVRRAIDFLQTRKEVDPRRIGISGVSLGAIVSSLSFAVEDRIKRGAFLLGGTDLAGILWKSSRTVPQRDAMRRKGVTEEALRDALKPIEPETYLPTLDARRAFVVYGLYDPVVPPGNSKRLIERLNDPAVLALDTGHYGGFLVQRRLFREVATFFDLELRDRRYDPPKKLLAPTTRVGLSATALDGVEVVLGIDLVKFDPQGRHTISFLLSPRTPSVFWGVEVSKGLSLGLQATPSRTAPGLFWSTVL